MTDRLGRRARLPAGLLLGLTLITGCGGVDQSGSGPGSSTTPHSTPRASAAPTATQPTTGPPTATGKTTLNSTTTMTPAPSQTKTPNTAPTSTSPATSNSCRSLAGALSLKQQIGQLFMAGTSSAGMSDAEAERLARLKVGSVILLENSTAGRATIKQVTDSIRHRVGTDHGVRPLLAADQEGGQVQRLAGPGFDTIPSARDQARMSTTELRASARIWGDQLHAAGIDADLAPVADVVPASIGDRNRPIGALDRGYGPDPKVVEQHDIAFLKGIQAAGVATSVKHFPNLGRVIGNTDFATDVTDDHTTRDDPDLRPFRGSVKAGVDMVMVSSARYTKIDPDSPATFSSTIVSRMVRDDLGFTGVIISDDLAGKALSSVPSRDRALDFLKAGGDLSIVGDPSTIEPMVQTVRRAAAQDPKLRQRIADSATRVLIMKARYGLTDCS
ncbi:glycoside hydrolase family 3 protein [Microlunatus elymi]|uniref:beta-N-acetylhexosaminidase n=1 Tax=Microlunatus elymi TaxID=2596828 RepID=A0A516Q478_9ACTN|nr:glycoside hydrolase family 3 N-terminal domain-containing protein [Microlunatus elymi]QDP98257.1 glycoside hydrolase family 3 protein [Microlunatus elymi]